MKELNVAPYLRQLTRLLDFDEQLRRNLDRLMLDAFGVGLGLADQRRQ
jgi:hypothetical protein